MDGPAGAGKGTVAKLLADSLGYLYVDTGAMYRALALKVLRSGVSPEDDQAVAALATQTEVRLQRGPTGDTQVFLDGVDVTQEIRTLEVTAIVSRVSAVPVLRQYMVDQQRSMARQGGVVMEGRDIGSYVLPDADLKLYVTATLEERARRRQEQLARSGQEIPLEDLIADIARRDEADMNKGANSLVILPESVYIDTTGKSIDQVVSEILSHCRRL